jgi:transposase-like protein
MKCVYCNGDSVVKRGMRYNDLGAKQRFLCKDCDGSFVEHDGFEHMRHKKEHIVRAIHDYEDGLSMKKVQNHLWQHDNVKIARKNLYAWVKKYGLFLKSGEFKRATSTQRKATHGRKVHKDKQKRRIRS